MYAFQLYGMAPVECIFECFMREISWIFGNLYNPKDRFSEERKRKTPVKTVY